MVLTRSSLLLVATLLCAPTAGFAQDSQPPMQDVERLTYPRFSYPSWSPDGTRILYESSTGGSWDIYLVDRAGIQDGGGNVRRLTHNGAADRMPSWSPDGKRIAFVSDRDGDFDVYVMDADGSNERRLTTNDLPEIHPYWASDNNRILFNRRIAGKRLYDIRWINPDTGEEEVLLSDDELNSYAQLSPDGTTVVFDKWFRNVETNGEIFLLRLPDRELVRLTENEVYDGYPAWTPNGRIVYSSLVGDDFKLFIMKPDGSGRRQLTFGLGSDARANVSRDGKRILFNRTIGDNVNIYSISLPD